MQKVVNEGQTYRRRVVSEDEARAELADEPYKLELIGLKGGHEGQESEQAIEGADAEVGAGELTIYDNLRRDGSVAWRDLCRGPHLPNTKLISNAFALTRSGGAYWRGSEKNPQLQRIYGTAWPTKEDLRAYTDRLAEAERRDHRKLGQELDLFSFPDQLGSGLAVFHPKGGILRKVMEDYSRERHEQAGYAFVNTPHITKSRAVRDQRPPRLVPRRDVPADARRRGVRRGRQRPQAGPGLLPQADELPDALPDLRRARPLLPRAAVAAVRVRVGLPLREVRRRSTG